VGGSVGVPLYLSQALAVAMYVFGFREGWQWLFPHHPALLVDLVTFGVVFGIGYVSAGLAFRIQHAVLVVIAVSLVLVFGSVAVWRSPIEPQLWGTYPGSPESGFSGTNFWAVFAVFFPAATGIMAGANMSGELRDPRRSIPAGTLWAIALSCLVYVALAVWAAKAASPGELASDYTVMLDRSLWAPGVLAGLLGATFSSALTSLVGAPRILAALASDRIIPRGEWLGKIDDGEPRRAMLVTGAIVLAGLLLRDLNVIAPLITMFFLITYTVINVVLLAESSLGLMSFRSTLRLPRIVPLLGALGRLFAMFIINATFSLVAVGVVVTLGSVKFLGLATRDTVADLEPRIRRLCTSFRKSGIMATSSIVDSAGFQEGTITGLQALGSAFFRPNILLLDLPSDPARHPAFAQLIAEAIRLEVGVILLGMHDKAGLGMAKAVNLWVPPRTAELSIPDYLRRHNLNLAILMGLRLAGAWRAELNLITVVATEAEMAGANAHMTELEDLCRMDRRAKHRVVVGDFKQALRDAPLADMDILGLRREPDLAFVAEAVRATRSSCLFAADSGWESAIT